MRLYAQSEPIQVRTNEVGAPAVFVWHGRVHRVETIEDVREPQLDWWAPSGEIHRLYYLVTTNRHLICDIYKDLATGTWYLARTFD